MNLEFDINKQTLTRTDSESPVEKSEGYLQARFTFSPDWNGLNAYALFTHDGKYTFMAEIVDGQCYVPHEVIQSGLFTVWCKAEDDDQTVLITTSKATIRVVETGPLKGDIEAISGIISDSLQVVRKGYKVSVELPNTYGTRIVVDGWNLSLIGRDNTVLNTVELPRQDVGSAIEEYFRNMELAERVEF